MTEPLSDRRIALGVTGSIAAYKGLAVASLLAQSGADVDVLMTRSACELVRPIAFQALTHRPVAHDLWNPVGPAGLDHIAIARAAELLLIAPATADVLARLALGRADDALTTTALACVAPVLVAPAMEPNMWAHPATQANVGTLLGRGVRFCGPEEGRMASGVLGLGRMAEPSDIVDDARLVFAASGPLAGHTVLVTAGPTREPIDPVRHLGNRSSGLMGLAVALEARNRGAEVRLITGPIASAPPRGVHHVAIETAEEMHRAVLEHIDTSDALIMAAAVADYAPADVSAEKLKKTPGPMTLLLHRTPDILVEVDRHLAGTGRNVVRVGFAAETGDLVSFARQKLEAKGLDLVVANPVPESFAGGSSRAILVDRAGEEELGVRPKAAIAEAIIDRVQRALAPAGGRSGGPTG
jgi:phosphopantothenoylcysteine decarboxylase/phosphopantothenate--cysteine ligase